MDGSGVDQDEAMTVVVCDKCGEKQEVDRRLGWRYGEDCSFIGIVLMIHGFAAAGLGMFFLLYVIWLLVAGSAEVPFVVEAASFLWFPYLPRPLSPFVACLLFSALGVAVILAGKELAKSWWVFDCRRCGATTRMLRG